MKEKKLAKLNKFFNIFVLTIGASFMLASVVFAIISKVKAESIFPQDVYLYGPELILLYMVPGFIVSIIAVLLLALKNETVRKAFFWVQFSILTWQTFIALVFLAGRLFSSRMESVSKIICNTVLLISYTIAFVIAVFIIDRERTNKKELQQNSEALIASLEEKYVCARDLLTKENYLEAKKLFEELKNYKNSEAFLRFCNEKLQEKEEK